MNRDHETALIRAFVVRRKQARYISLLDSQNGRQKFLRELDHFHDFEPAYVIPIRGSDSVDQLVDELKKRGAQDVCYVISFNGEPDGTTVPLREVIASVYGRIEGTLISCSRGRLGYYEGEAPKNRVILQRQNG
jgi:hypothetical protein